MQSSNRAMIWYFWRISRYNMLLFTVAACAAAYFVKIMEPGVPGVGFGRISLTVQVFLIAVLGGSLFQWRNDSSFLPHPCLLTLPLATSRYLALFYGYVIVVVGAISCAAAALHLHFFGNVIQAEDPRVTLEFWQIPLLCVALACLIQSMYHLSDLKNEFRVIPMAIAAEALVITCALPLLDPGNRIGHYLGYTACLALLFSWASSYNALTAHRFGARHGGIAALLEWIDFGRRRTSPFSSSDTALFWAGWRRYGRVFSLWALSLTLIVLPLYTAVFLIWPENQERDFTSSKFIVGALSIAILILFVTAFLSHIVLLRRSHEDFVGAGRGFFLTLPVRSGALVRGRLWATTLSYLIIVAAEMSLLLLSARISPDFNAMIFLEFPTMTYILLGLWLTLWLGLPMISGYILLLMMFSGAQLLGYELNESYVIFGFAILFIITTLFFLFKGARNRVMGRAGLLLFAVFMLFPIAFIVVNDAQTQRDLPDHLCFSAIVFGLFLPVALPFVVAPVLVNWVRHR